LSGRATRARVPRRGRQGPSLNERLDLFRAAARNPTSPPSPDACCVRLSQAPPRRPRTGRFGLRNEVRIAAGPEMPRDAVGERFRLSRTERRSHPEAAVTIVASDRGSRIDVRAEVVVGAPDAPAIASRASW
jgi:hypothetical protein